MCAARLRRSGDIAKVRAEGRSIRRPTFVARVRRTASTELRIAVVAPGAVGGAVVRNRARRRVREAFRTALQAGVGEFGADMVVTARREAVAADFGVMRADAASLLRDSAS